MARVVKVTVAVLFSLGAVLLAWGFVEPYTISMEGYEVALDGLSPAWEGERIAVVSDFQVGMWLDNVWTIRRVMRRLADERPVLVLILGDFIYHGGEDPSERIETVVALIEPLTKANIPVYVVLGNHDYSVVTSKAPNVDEERARSLRRALEAIGVRVLQNEAVPLIPTGEEAAERDALYLVGIGSIMAEKARPGAALEGVPEGAARVVMMHHPDTFAGVSAYAAPLAVAGHTHGGQVRLPYTPEWTYLTYVTEARIHVDGWIKDYGQAGNRLYVNRGVGFSKLPLRINCPPEITLFTLARPTH
jgi:hypothetical protein